MADCLGNSERAALAGVLPCATSAETVSVAAQWPAPSRSRSPNDVDIRDVPSRAETSSCVDGRERARAICDAKRPREVR